MSRSSLVAFSRQSLHVKTALDWRVELLIPMEKHPKTQGYFEVLAMKMRKVQIHAVCCDKK